MDYWRKQQDKPLYPDLLWSKPVTKRGAGKLLIIGGNAHGFSNVAQVYAEADRFGAGHIRAVVPDSLSKLTKGLPFIEYAPSNPSGGFAKSALGTLLELAEWSDGVLIAGDLGKNSETSLLLDSFLDTCPGLVIISPEGLSSISISTNELVFSPNRVVIWTRSELQKATISLKMSKTVTSQTGKSQFAEILHDVSIWALANIVEIDEYTIWVACNGEVISTDTDMVSISAKFAVWAIQNPTKIKEALVCASWELKSSNP